MNGAFQQIIQHWQDAGNTWIDAKLKSDQLEEDARPYLASLMNDLARAAREKVSETHLDREARGSENYRAYVSRMVLAKAETLRARVKFDAIDKTFEARRSHEAMERAKIEKGIFHEGKG